MVFSMGEQSDLQSESAQASGGGKAPPEWTKQIDAELAFRLIDSILPFEACLYHQILPLSLEGSRLRLGMVNLDDTAAIDYVRRILAYMNCSLVPQLLASDIHYAALSAYLNYADQQRNSAQPVARRIAKKLAEQTSKRSLEANRSSDLHSNPTLVVDSPTVLPAMPVEEEIGANPHDLTVAELPPELPTDQPKTLTIHPQHLAEPPETLIHLPPTQLLEELLGRVLLGGIGRLHLECTEAQGRILWSQNGTLQAILENLPLATFAGVIQELKLLTQLPLVPIQKPKQVELDRIYQNQRLLFRLRLMLNKQGREEATLQILRGAALRFYRQQQLVAVGQEALSIAQNLQQKMSDVYRYSRSHGVEMPAHLSILPELDRTLKRISYQLNDLQSLKFPEPDDEG
jgi:type II secretory ATPase GspE/PulE/Tfp pilus assembly ATPase PilB-like protein